MFSIGKNTTFDFKLKDALILLFHHVIDKETKKNHNLYFKKVSRSQRFSQTINSNNKFTDINLGI